MTVRSFKHNQGGQSTSVTIIDAPTREAAAFAQHLVESGQMLSEDEVRKLRKKGLLREGQPVEPRVHRALLSQAHKTAEWQAYQAENRPTTQQERATRGRAAVAKRELEAATKIVNEEDDDEVVTVGARNKVK